MPNLNPQDARTYTPAADTLEVRRADQHPVAQADGRREQHFVVPDPPHPVPPVSRLHRRSLTCRPFGSTTMSS
jgi:hypothetical protein